MEKEKRPPYGNPLSGDNKTPHAKHEEYGMSLNDLLDYPGRIPSPRYHVTMYRRKSTRGQKDGRRRDGRNICTSLDERTNDYRDGMTGGVIFMERFAAEFPYKYSSTSNYTVELCGMLPLPSLCFLSAGDRERYRDIRRNRDKKGR